MWLQWSKWLEEGFYVSYLRDETRYFEHIISRDFAHYEYAWPETITTVTESGPYVPDDLEITRGYDSRTNTNQFWQLIFGIKGQVYIYIELPTDIHRHGLPKQPKPSSALRQTSHYEEWMSPFQEPTFITEHFMMRPENYNIAFSAYNPQAIDMPGVRLNIFLAKFQTERIGSAQAGVLTVNQVRWKDLLEKLHDQRIPSKPLTLMPVRAPAEAPAGQ